MQEPAMLDIHRLKIFLKVADLKSFSRAAYELYLTQPTVSQHISLLEEHLGLLLFDRTGREVTPTKAGNLLYGYARQILLLQDEAQQALDLFKGKKSGHIQIGASTIPGEYILPPLLGALRAAYPDIRVTVRIAGTEKIIDELLNRSVEIGVVGAKIKDDRLLYSRLVDDELVLVIPRGHQWWQKKCVGSQELLTEPFVLREHGSGTRIAMERHLQAAGIQPDKLIIAAEVGSTTAIKEAVKARLGISFISERAIQDELKAGLFRKVPVRGEVFKRTFYIVSQRNRTPSPLCKAFVDFLREQH